MNPNNNQREIYQIREGNLMSSDLKIPIHFGLVYNDDGVIKLEIVVDKSFDLSSFSNKQIDELLKLDFNAFCYSIDNNKLEFFKLVISKFIPAQSKISLICYDCMIYTKLNKKEISEKSISESSLYYLEIEGLNMFFCDITEKVELRAGEKVHDLNNWERDHAKVLLKLPNSNYNQIFYKSSEGDNIIVDFVNKTDDFLLYSDFLKIKLEYSYFISLFNGAEVKIRREFIGDFYTIGKASSHISKTYSFKKINNIRFNDFFPLNNPINVGSNILNYAFTDCFENYCNWNEKLNLNSIVFYLNNAEQSKSMDEKFFVQMIAFERLTTYYAEYLGKKEEYFPSFDDFKAIKDELLEVLDRHKVSFGTYYNSAKSKLCNINQVKSFSTVEKMYRILYDFSIPVDNNVKQLIEIVRHKTIHKGEFGDGKEKISNFYLLDSILRRILVKLIGYKNLYSTKY